MADWDKVINAIIAKVGFTYAVIATVTSIIFYKLFLTDVLWAIVVGCSTYFMLLCIAKLVKLIKKIFVCYKEYRCRELQCLWFYNTLSDGMKASLLSLCKLPHYGHKYSRIISENNNQNAQIIYDCKYIQRNTKDYNLITVSQGLDSDRYTIIFDECLYDVIQKHSKNDQLENI